jgi:multidrug efflux pump subunit AcrA (membrane-fusion protein)
MEWRGIPPPADRDTLFQQHQQEVNRLQQEVDRRDPERHPEVIQSRVTLQKFRELMDQGPAAVAEWLDNFSVNRPLLEAEIRAQTLQAQLEARQQQSTQYEQEQVIARVSQELPGYVEQNIAALISQTPELASLKGSEKKLVEQLWPYIGSLLWEADRDYPEYGVRQGQIVPRKELFLQALTQEANRRAELKRLEDAARHNARALGNGSKTPKTVPARGQPVPAGQKPRAFKPGEAREAKDAFLDWDPLAE